MPDRQGAGKRPSSAWGPLSAGTLLCYNETAWGSAGETAMLLGELLVYRYRLITNQQRTQALEQQRESDRGRHLGEILMDMGLISQSDLHEVLNYQIHERDPWHNAL